MMIQRSDRATVPDMLTEAKGRLRILHFDDDAEISLMAQAAVREMEEYASIAVFDQTVTVTFDPPPLASTIRLPIGPVQSGAEVTATFDGGPFTDFTLIPGTRPAIRTDEDELLIGALVVTYRAGFGTQQSDVPPDVMNAILDQVCATFDMKGQADARHLALAGNSPQFTRVAARYRRVAI